MMIASGYIELLSEEFKEKVVNEMNLRGIETPEFEGNKIVFLVEADSENIIKAKLDDLKKIEGVLGVMLAYFSVSGADEGESFEI